MTVPQSVIDYMDRTPDKLVKPWQPWEEEVVRKYAQSKGLAAVARVLKRSYSSIKNKHEQILSDEVNRK